MTRWRHDVIFIVVDNLTKISHFILDILKDGSLALAKKSVQEVFRLQSVPKTIISNRDTRMTSRFWMTLNASLETQLNFNTTYHP